MRINKKTLAADICLICAVLAIAGVLFLIPKPQGNTAELLLNGESIGSYALATNKTVEVKDKNGDYISTLNIKDGKAFLTDACCNGGDCLRQGKIFKEGQCIVCLPKGLTIIIRGNGGIDGVTG